MSRIARTFIRRIGAPMLAVPALVVGAGPASADGYARFDDAVVTVSPDCTGTVRAGYNRANFFAGSGTIVVTVSTNPHPSEVQITV